jgi:hypothetical protein
LAPGDDTAEKEEKKRTRKVPHTLFRMIKNKAKVFGPSMKASK